MTVKPLEMSYAMLMIPNALQKGLSLQQQGRLTEAAKLYEAVLQEDPRQPDALHLLGLIASSRGDYHRAVELIRRAISESPQNATLYGNLGVALRQSGQYEAAIAAYQQSLALEPNASRIYFNLGKSLKLADRIIDAEAAFRKAVELEPTFPSPWVSLMNIYVQRRDLEAAIKLAQQALAECPNSSEIHMNLGVVFKKSHRTDEGLSHLLKAVELAPRNIDALCKLATCQIATNQIEAGVKHLELARSIAPQHMNVLNATGFYHYTASENELAEQAYRQSIAIYPNDASAHVCLGNVLRNLGRLDEALTSMGNGLRLEPDNAEAWINSGVVHLSLGNIDVAESNLKKGIALRTDCCEAHSNLLMCQQYSTRLTADEINQAHREWGRKCSPARVESFVKRPLLASRPLRLGFVSADLGCHPVGFFALSIFENLAPAQFETFVYSDRFGDDPIQQRIQRAATSWKQSKALSDHRLWEEIANDQVDILFDLAGHTAHNRLRLFARRAAPVQITWAGYVGTTGIESMDYLLADRYHVPEGCEHLYLERVLRMPNDYICFTPPPVSPTVGELPALKKGYVSFAAMANPAKVNDAVLRLWGEVLSRIPNSRLLLCYCGWTDPTNQERVHKVLSQYDAEQRVSFAQCSGQIEVLNMYNQIDMALDTFPYSGGLTTCEALWMGVPTITWPAERFAGRHSLSHLSNVGLQEWVADSATSYVEIAQRRADNLTELAVLRKHLREMLVHSPLCDGQSFANDFGKLMIHCWNS